MMDALKTLEEIAAEDAFVYRVDLPDRRAIEAHAHAQGQLFSVESGLCIIETSTGSWLFPAPALWLDPRRTSTFHAFKRADAGLVFVSRRAAL